MIFLLLLNGCFAGLAQSTVIRARYAHFRFVFFFENAYADIV